MRKLTLTDIRGPEVYAQIRDDLRKKVIEVKRVRRVAVGPEVSLVFENRATMIFQIEEMCRAEGLRAPEQIQPEIDIYNHVLPDDGELGATLLVEITKEAEIEPRLSALVGLQNHVWLRIGETRVQATFDPDQFKVDRLAAVQYLRFALPAAARAAIATPGAKLALEIDHPSYRHRTTLTDETRASLAKDLD
jgi:hypothetical protein